MPVLEIVQSLNAALELAKHANAAALPAPDRRRIQYLKELIEALRRIYFAPRSVVSLLEQIAQGIEPSAEQVAAILPSFNDFEYHMPRYLDRLDPENGHGNQHLTLRGERLLREIAWGKKGVRHGVQSLLNEALTSREKISPCEAENLLEQITQLNLAIEAAEEALVKTLR